ncbi:MAG: TolC family protein [Vicinamibacteraceae bacterium]
MSSSLHLRAPIMRLGTMGVLWALRAIGLMIAPTCVLACLAPLYASAPQEPSEPLTLDAAISRALAANPDLAAARLARSIDAAGLAVAAERPNPDVSIEVEKEAPRQAFAVSWPLELGGKRGKRIAVGRAALGATEADLRGLVLQMRNDVRRRYSDAVVADAKLGVLRELRDVAERATATAQTRFERGDAPRLEVLQAALALDAADTETSAAAGVVGAARAKLNALLALPLESTQPLTTSMDASGEIVTSAMVARARAASTELALADRRIDEQRAKASLARALRVPDATPTATLTHGAEPEFTYGWRAGLSITLPVLTTHQAGVVVEDARLAQLAAQREAMLQRVVGDVTAASALAEAQRQASVRYHDVIVPRAKQVEEMAQDSYRLGQTGLPALLQALQASRDVRLRALDAVAQFQSGVADLERAVGAPLP